MRLGGWKFISWYHAFRNKSESFDSVCSAANMPINSIEFAAVVPCFKCYINLTSMHCTLEGIHSSYMTAEGTACELLKHKSTSLEANTVQWTSYHPCTEALDVATWLTMTLNNFYPSWSIPMCWNRVNSLSKKKIMWISKNKNNRCKGSDNLTWAWTAEAAIYDRWKYKNKVRELATSCPDAKPSCTSTGSKTSLSFKGCFCNSAKSTSKSLCWWVNLPHSRRSTPFAQTC